MLYSVMLVDNEPASPQGLLRLIDWGENGCQVDAIASDGADAIRKIEQQQPDIVISDIRMPEKSGLELCEWIKTHFPRIQVILLTGFPDFEYAQQAIQYEVVDFVLKPTEDTALIAALEKARRRLSAENADGGQSLALRQQMLLSELVFQSRHSLLYTENRLHELSISLTRYYVLCLNVMPHGASTQTEADLSQAQETLRSCCRPNPVYLVPRNDFSCYAVLCLPEPEDPFYIASSVVEMVDLEMDFMVSIGISRCYTEPLQLKKAVREADDAQQFTLYSSQVSVMRCEDLPSMTEEAAAAIQRELKLVESALENRNREAVQRQLDSFFHCIRTSNIPFSGMRQMALLLYNLCIGLLVNYNLSAGSLPQELSDLQAENQDELEHELRSFVLSTVDSIRNTPGNMDNIVMEIKKYIDQNYSQSLSLDLLAAQVYLSPSYLSKLFKKEMNENLSTYILHTRIDHAKILLRTTDKKTYEIAEAVGIYDPVYFSKIFKKATGLKPKEYRNQPDK